MKGRQKGRPTKWVTIRLGEYVNVGKRGAEFEVWEKWRRKDRKLGTLSVTVGGLAWRPSNGKRFLRKSWNTIANWFESGSDR